MTSRERVGQFNGEKKKEFSLKKPGACPEISDWIENNARKALWAPSSPFFHVLLRSSSVTPSFLSALRPIVRPQKQVSFERWVHLSSSSSCPRRTLRASQTPTHADPKEQYEWTEIHRGTNFSFFFHLDAALFGFGLLKKIFAVFCCRLKGSLLMRRHTTLLHLRGSSLLLIPPLLS